MFTITSVPSQILHLDECQHQLLMSMLASGLLRRRTGWRAGGVNTRFRMKGSNTAKAGGVDRLVINQTDGDDNMLDQTGPNAERAVQRRV
jgi:hypothetical protein